jgi:hypothetical protein
MKREGIMKFINAVVGIVFVAGLAIMILGTTRFAQAQGPNGCRTQRHDRGAVNADGSVTWSFSQSFITCSQGCDAGFQCTFRKMGQTRQGGTLYDVVTCVCVQNAGQGGGAAVIVPAPPPIIPPEEYSMYCDQAEYQDPGTGVPAAIAGCLDTNDCGGSGEVCVEGTSIEIAGPLVEDGVTVIPAGHVEKITDGCICD